MNSSGRQHAGGGSPTQVPEAPEPSFAERARTLLHLGRTGSLSTLSRKHVGFPFGSVMPYGLEDSGHPLFLISTMAMHTQNLQVNPRASLLVVQPDWQGDPLAGARVTVLGNVVVIPADQRPAARTAYLARHENAKSWIDFDDFAFYRLEILDAYYVGGFGVMGWLTGTDYLLATPDPLADAAARILSHMNADHADALKLLAKANLGIDADEISITSVDRLGFHVRMKVGPRVRGGRIGFGREVATAEAARNVLVDMVEEARKNGA